MLSPTKKKKKMGSGFADVKAVFFFFLFRANTSDPLLLEITVVLKMRGAGASPASGVHLALSVSGCDICSLISSWVTTRLTVQRCPVCSVSVTTSLQTIFYVYMGTGGKKKPRTRPLRFIFPNFIHAICYLCKNISSLCFRSCRNFHFWHLSINVNV